MAIQLEAQTMASKKIEREYEAKGISAHPEWWAEVEATAAELGINRSAFIRMAVNEYLKIDGVDTPKPAQVAA